MVQKRRSLELFEVYAEARQHDRQPRREQEFVKAEADTRMGGLGGTGMPVAQETPGYTDTGRVRADPEPTTAERAPDPGHGHLVLRLRYWTAVAMVACVALAVLSAYRLGEYVATHQRSEAEQARQPKPAVRPPSRFEDLQVARARPTAAAAMGRRRAAPRTATRVAGPKRGGQHRLVVAIYHLRDKQRVQRALQAFRAEGFTDMTLDVAGKYNRLLSSGFASVSSAEAKKHRDRILAVGKKLNRQYNLGSKTDFRDCYWETVK